MAELKAAHRNGGLYTAGVPILVGSHNFRETTLQGALRKLWDSMHAHLMDNFGSLRQHPEMQSPHHFSEQPKGRDMPRRRYGPGPYDFEECTVDFFPEWSRRIFFKAWETEVLKNRKEVH